MKKLLAFVLLITHLPLLSISIQTVILAGGGSTRWKGDITKLCTPIDKVAMVLHPLLAIEKDIEKIVVVGHQKELVKKIITDANIEKVTFALQKEQCGTGHALCCTKHLWHADSILVLNGDMPLITKDIVDAFIAHHEKEHATLTIVVSYNVDPKNTFGRIVKKGDYVSVIEKKHFTYDIRDYPYVNAGLYLINRDFLEQYIDSIEQNETTHEFYITDLIEIASKHKFKVALLEVPFEYVHGVNTYEEFEQVTRIKKRLHH